MAWATASSWKIWFHSPKTRFVGITVDCRRSCRAEIPGKNRWLSGWRRPTYPTSSPSKTAGAWDCRSARWSVWVASAAVSRLTRPASVVNPTRRPGWHWAVPRARARGVLPSPLPPTNRAPVPSATRSVARRVRDPAPELPGGGVVLEVERLRRLDLDAAGGLDPGRHRALGAPGQLPVGQGLERLAEPGALLGGARAPGGERLGRGHELEAGELLFKRQGRHRDPPLQAGRGPGPGAGQRSGPGSGAARAR